MKLLPIYNREDYIGGIESIVIDNNRFFLGFSYRDDMVLSPPISDEKLMAKFAAEFMEQRDGKHDEEYWGELVLESINHSELTDDVHNYELNLDEKVERIIGENETDKSFDIDYHILYLINCILHDDIKNLPFDKADEDLFKLMEFDDSQFWLENIEKLKDILQGKELLKKGEVKDAALLFRVTIRLVVQQLPESWQTIFYNCGLVGKE